MSTVVVIARPGAGRDGALEELRAALADEGVTDARFDEVSDIRKVPESARHAVDEGADLIFVYGGDGTVQLCIHGLAGRQAALAILPGGTGNVLAGNLGIPEDHRGAPRVCVYRGRRGNFSEGDVSMVLVGNVGRTVGSFQVFKDALPDDGFLELGVVTAHNAVEWIRTMGRVVVGSPEESPSVEVTRGQRFEIKFAEPVLYQVDGNPRKAVKRLRVIVHPGSITLCVPASPRT